MKIKCPGCAALLQIPDTAAGKVVKCKCGKAMRAPAPAGAARAGTARSSGGQAATASRSASGPPARAGAPAQRPRVSPGVTAAAAPSPGIFDELTDTDLAPVKPVHFPGKTNPYAVNSSKSSSKALEDAISGGDRRGDALTMQTEAPRPPFLIFIGIVNALWAVAYFGLMMLLIGLFSMVPALEEEIPEASGGVMYLICGAMAILGILSIATCVACFVRSKISWYILVVSYSYGFADRVLGLIGDLTDPDVDIRVMRAVGGILVGIGLWAYMHGDDVRAYHGTESEPIWKIITFNAVGLLLGAGIGAAVVYMA
ncbi:hypothetical protein FYK55_03205 [Roseiconus nitratireducens]|uniref:Uncharacterized protein n=1 Tax=Roseiconus nitratireducens TaxID=2605748 RepID=A0A5M6DKR5_9BACT|nr:hypothetical protein [Roseiconus nitratireducens]KAA5545935.1 hypothetical protein FYK55_03205 [Roseiconus nitratireducens]